MSEEDVTESITTAEQHNTAATSDDVASRLDEVFLDLECFSAGELSKLCISRDFFGTT